MRVKLTEIARVIRSKNAGPFELTLDVFFRSKELFEQVCAAEAFRRDNVAALYGIAPERITKIVLFAPANAIKITLTREIPSGGIGDDDVYGAQQHIPLLNMELEIEGFAQRNLGP